MENVKERIEAFRNEVKIYREIPEKPKGGQQVGICEAYPTVVEHEGLGVKITIKAFRSDHRNRELAMQLFYLAFDELVK